MALPTALFPTPWRSSPTTKSEGIQEEVEDGTSMILDTGCTKAMCSRRAYLLMRQGLSEDRVELLPDSSTLNFANGFGEREVQNLVLI